MSQSVFPPNDPVILIIDDEAVVRHSVRNYLEDLDYTVFDASNGREGLEILVRERPDVILVDLRMPEMSGFEFLEKASRRVTDTPLVVMSGTGEIRDVVRALHLGAWDYVLKPVQDLEVIQHTLSRVLERARLIRESREYQQRLESEVTHRTAELKAANEELRLSASAFDIQESILITDNNTRIVRVNNAFTRITGYTAAEVMGETPRILRSDRHDREFYERMWDQLLRNGYWTGEVWNRRKCGEVYPQWLSISAVKNEGGEVTHYVGTGLDLTEQSRQREDIERRAMEEKALNTLARLSLQSMSMEQYLENAITSLLESVSWLQHVKKGGIYLTEDTGRGDNLTLVAACQPPQQILTAPVRIAAAQCFCGRKTSKRVLLHHKASGDKAADSRDDQEPFSHYNVPILRGGDLLGSLVLYVPDDYESTGHEARFLERVGDGLTLGILRKYAEEQANYLAFYDELTGLPNRNLFLDRLNQSTSSAQRDGTCGGLLFIDLDNFKTLNDGLGHSMGDLLLRKVAQRIKDQLRAEDTIARLGGDEFVVLIPRLRGTRDKIGVEMSAISEKICAAVAQPFQLETQGYSASCSIGIALFPDDSEQAKELLRCADIAMYSAKQAGRGTARFYQKNMHTIIESRLQIGRDLRQAIEDDQLMLYYQPLVDYNRGIVGAEALLRWRHAKHGFIAPDRFIPVAEESGLILPIGQWVVEKACKQLKAWEDQPATDHLRYLSINLSTWQLREPNFLGKLKETLDNTGANPNLLKLEITESVMAEDTAALIDKMHAIRELGVSFAIDDFGTGYSSFSYLKQLPVDTVKIDKSFIRDVASDPNVDAIVEAMLAMVSHLSMEVIAEGVESSQQFALLRRIGCQLYQGFLFYKPMPASDFTKTVADTTMAFADPAWPQTPVK